MNWVDIILLSILAFSTLVSLLRGFIKEVLSLVIWVVAFVGATRYAPIVSEQFSGIESDALRQTISMVIVFVGVLIVGAMVNYIFGELIQKTGLSGTDRVLGMIFGLLRGFMVIALLLYLATELTAIPEMQMWKESILVPEFEKMVTPLIGVYEENIELIKNQDLLNPDDINLLPNN